MQTIAVCICTYGRPVGLAAQLPRLARQQVPENTSIKIIVADNNPDGSARTVVERVAADGGHPIVYVAEPQPGISHARNASFAAARQADWIAVCDDDDLVPEDWLRLMFEAATKFGADAVVGSYVFDPNELPLWVIKAGMGASPQYATGTRIDYGVTTNCLVSGKFAFLHTPPFPVELARSAGEDLYFFRRILDAGAKIVWCEEARISRTVNERASPWRWIRGWHAGGANTAYVDLALSKIDRAGLAKAATLGVLGGFRQCLGELRRGNVYRSLRGVRDVVFNIGRLGRLAGIHPQIYRPGA